MWPSSGYTGTCGLPQMPALAEVVAVVGAEDERRRVPRVVPIDDLDDPPEPVVDHRELGAVLAPQVTALALGAGRTARGSVAYGGQMSRSPSQSGS